MSCSRLARHSGDDDKKSCWVCFATDEDDWSEAWVQPCKCKGTTKWVHQVCLQRWIDEKQKGNSTAEVSCPQCNTKYRIVFPRLGLVVSFMDMVDKVIYKVCPFVAGGIFVGSVYWTAVTYGAVTVMQVLGHKEGLGVMERADPLFLLIGLPTIPVMLILCKMIRWEDYVLRIWRKHSPKLPLVNQLTGSNNGTPMRVPADTMSLSDPTSATRVLCGALVLPTLATVVGKIMFSSVTSNFQRTLLGGVALVTIKGILRIYFKQQQYLRQAQRVVLDYDVPPAEDDRTMMSNSDASPSPSSPNLLQDDGADEYGSFSQDLLQDDPNLMEDYGPMSSSMLHEEVTADNSGSFIN